MKNDFTTALDAFVTTLQARLDAYHNANFPTLTENGTKRYETITTEPGSKYVRIVSDNGTQRSVFCFIRKSDGAVLKAAGWKAPAKHARGSIYTPDHGMSAVTEYGANYL